MTKIAHVLGNGPSRGAFVNDPIGDAYGCNLSDFSLDLKATFIMDAVCANHIHNNRVHLPWPVIVCSAHERTMKHCDPKVSVLETIDEHLENGESTGHRALKWCMIRYDEVHAWGFDSMWKENVNSDSHTKIPEGIHCDRNYRSWRKNFEKLEKEFPRVKLVFHRPA